MHWLFTKSKVCDPLHWRDVGSANSLQFLILPCPIPPPIYTVQWSDCSATKFYVVQLCYILQTVNLVARWHCWCWLAEGGLVWREVIVDKGHGSPHITLPVMDWYTHSKRSGKSTLRRGLLERIAAPAEISPPVNWGPCRGGSWLTGSTSREGTPS